MEKRNEIMLELVNENPLDSMCLVSTLRLERKKQTQVLNVGSSDITAEALRFCKIGELFKFVCIEPRIKELHEHMLHYLT